MAVHIARPVDARLVRDMLNDFFDQRSIEYKPQTLQRIRQRFGYNVVWVQDEEPHAFVMLRLHQEEVEIAGLFPRGMLRSRLKPVLVAAIRDVYQRFPQAGSQRVWAEFPFTDDLGEGECLAWRSEWPQGVLMVSQPKPGMLWVIESTLERLV